MLFALLFTAAAVPAIAATDGTLSGTVRDQTGGVIPRAAVHVQCGPAAAQLITDVHGAFTIDGLPTERCTIEVRGEGFARAVLSADLSRAPSQTLQVVLQLERFASELLVTSTRGVEEPSFSVPQGSSVVHGSALASRPHQLLTQALREEPGVLVQSTTAAQGSASVRGFTGQRNVYLLDGVRLNTSAWRDGPSQYLAWIAPSIVDRLEIVRGPGSVQYGSDALGATINVLTAPPPFSDAGTHASGTVSGTVASAMRSGGLDASVSVTAPTVAVRVGGWRTRIGDLRPGQGRDSHAAVTRFLGVPSEQVGTRLTDTGFTQSSGFVVGRARLGEDARIHASYLRDEQAGAVRYDRTLGGAGLHRSEFSPQTLDFGLLRLDRGRTAVFDHVTATLSINRQADGRLEQTRPNARIDEQVTRTTAVGYQAQASRTLRDRHLLLAGAEVYDEHISGSRTITEPAGPARPDRPDIPDGTRYLSTGLFVQTVSELVPSRVTVRGGLRFGHFGFSTRADPVLGVSHERLNTSAMTFNGGAVFGVTREINLVGSVSRGFRAANAFDLGGIGVSGGGGFEISPSRAVELGALRGTTDGATAVSSGRPIESLGPEVLMAYEGGVKVQAGRIAGSVLAFDLELSDTIDRRTLIFDRPIVGTSVAGFEIVRQDAEGRAFVAVDPRPIVSRVNISRNRIRGVEGNVVVAVTEQWQARAHVSTANGRDLQSGAYMRRMPPMLGGGAVRWQRQGLWAEATATFAGAQTRLSDGDVSDARIGASRTRASIAGFFSGSAVDLGLVRNGTLLATGETLPQVQDRLLGAAASAAMFTGTPGFTVLGARVGIPFGNNLELTVLAENLLDRNYRLHGSGIDEPGFNLQLRTRVRF